jgi:hypothetical protein
MYYSANNGIAFSSDGTNLSGPNKLIKYDTFKDRVAYISDMGSMLAQLKAITGSTYNGFQDIAEDTAGNAYYMTSFGPSIIKVTPDGTPSIFYYSAPSFVNGTTTETWGGIFSVGNILVTLNNTNGLMFRLDTTVKNPLTDYTIYPLVNSPAGVACDR